MHCKSKLLSQITVESESKETHKCQLDGYKKMLLFYKAVKPLKNSRDGQNRESLTYCTHCNMYHCYCTFLHLAHLSDSVCARVYVWCVCVCWQSPPTSPDSR